jgi:F-type H+-transporting ATPase subunit alpha
MSGFDTITEDVRKAIENYTDNGGVTSAGRIVSCNDGVIMIEGLKDVKNDELLYLGNSQYALALNLEEKYIGAIVLTSGQVSAGDTAYATGKIVSVPVGEALLGRVVDALGAPLDGGKTPKCGEFRSVEFPAPAIFDREKVNEPLYTGIKAIDGMVPIGKGQRELIIGDRQTGKTSIAADAIINQKGKNVVCVYVAIGQKASSVAKIIRKFNDCGASAYTVVVAATAGQSAPLQYLAPYTGTAIAEYFMYKGQDALIVYDDLTKHAVAYRTISLLLKRPSGREAYPGDIFYIHSRLLERSAHLSQKLGGGSLTALPIIETLAGDISAYIPTNVISITDGQIYLEEELFNEGMRPAINVGLSVSRVGGAAQTKGMKKIGGVARLDLAHYREMVLFSRFGSDIDAATKAVIAKGERMTEVIKQPLGDPKSMSETIITLYIAMNNLLKNVEVSSVAYFMKGFLDYLHTYYASVLSDIDGTGEFDEGQQEKVKKIFAEYEALV